MDTFLYLQQIYNLLLLQQIYFYNLPSLNQYDLEYLNRFITIVEI